MAVFYSTDYVAGKDPVSYVGLVHGIGIADRGRMADAVNQANDQIDKAAEGFGANAIVGMKYDSVAIGNNIVLHVYGTAVKY